VNLDHLPPLRDVLDAHDLAAKKSFGQHFLFDLNITRKIARLAGVGAGDHVIEVGPGPAA
jgi:16S rRNA (adenine1518-N6/adenine1519-N6)-dimethyltransferase